MEYYRISSAYGMEIPRKKYLNIIGKAQNVINILCGEFDPKFYNSNEFVENIDRFLKSNSKELSVVFHGDENKEKAIENINKYNSNFEIMLAHNGNRGKVNMRWMPFRAKRHYTIVDNSTTLVEGSHKIGRSRDLYVFEEDKKIAAEWNERFEEIKEYSDVIELDLSRYIEQGELNF